MACLECQRLGEEISHTKNIQGRTGRCAALEVLNDILNFHSHVKSKNFLEKDDTNLRNR
jgi:hypothetical protein